MRYLFALLSFLAFAKIGFAAPLEFVDEECQQGYCTGYYILDVRVVGENGIGKLIQVMTSRVAYSVLPGAKNDQRHPDVTSDTFYEFCSRLRPASIFKLSGDQKWVAHILSPGYSDGFSWATYDSYVRYFRFCHDLRRADPTNMFFARRYGYSDGLLRNVGQIDLQNPEDIMGR
jgi:hypothetical protein